MSLADPLDAVVGQEHAVAMLRAAVRDPVPAYLLVGPSGAGVREAAAAFAGALLSEANPGSDDDRDRHLRLAMAEEHPDLVVIEREGPFITADQARMAVRAASTTPAAGARKVVMMIDLHLVRDAGPMLLKSIEEPSPSTIFVLLADEVPPELVTIASRCVRVDFAAVEADALVELLVGEGVDAERARFAAEVAAGSIRRARLLASDDGVMGRWEMWRDISGRLDGSGHTVGAIVEELLEAIDGSAAPLEAVHERELAELAERAERFGERGLGRAGVAERHKRELRRLRTEELLMGFTALGRAVRSELDHGRRSARNAIRALDAVGAAGEALTRNPNERLLLQNTLFEVGAPDRE